MKKISGLLLAGLALILHFAQAQSFAESALLFSRTHPGGSARIQGMGGTQVSLGGDYSSAFSNPAGLGMYNRGEVTFTPSLNFAKTNSTYLGTTTDVNKSNFTLPGFSVAFHKDSERGNGGFLGGTFAITYNRINDFNRDLRYEGLNEDNSIIDYFIDQANGYPPSQFDEGDDLYNTVTELAWNNFLFEEDPNDPDFYYPPNTAGIPYQAETIETRGTQNQWSFAYGANFSDKFYLGASLGFTSLRYSSIKFYSESFDNEPLNNLAIEENLEITGSGVNFNIGGIFRPVDQFQIGASVSTPTAYQLSDTYDATLSTRWDNFEYDQGFFLNNLSESTDIIISEYNLNTPWKLSAGLTYFVGKNGFISADVEQLNYSNAKYSSTGSSYSEADEKDDNSRIKSLYKSTTNFRLGGEYRYKKLRGRAGFNYMTDPFNDAQNGINRKVAGVSGGLGYRSVKFFIDMAVTYSKGKNSYRPYSVANNSPLVTFNQQNTNVLVTLGFPF